MYGAIFTKMFLFVSATLIKPKRKRLHKIVSPIINYMSSYNDVLEPFKFQLKLF